MHMNVEAMQSHGAQGAGLVLGRCRSVAGLVLGWYRVGARSVPGWCWVYPLAEWSGWEILPINFQF